GRSTSDDEATVGHGGVITGEGVGVDEGDRGVVVGEVVGHRHDRLLDLGGVRSVLQDDVTVTRVLLPRLEVWAGAASGRVDSRLGWHRVLDATGDTGNSTNRIGMTLAEAPPPERVGGTCRQDRLTIETVEGEQARIPAGGDEADGASVAGGRIDTIEVLVDAGVGVEAVDDVEASS